MSLDRGRPYLAIPGPSVMPDAVLRAMHRPAPNIYTGELHDMMPGLLSDLRKVARTRHHCAIYIANGHGAWEAALANVLSRGDKVLALVTGRFGQGWAKVAEGLGADVEVMDFGLRDPVDVDRVARRLAEDDAHGIRAVLAVHVDTATSVRNDVAAIRAALDAADHPALLLADCIASLGCDRFEMDDWGVDVAITASQKGLMTPPGVAFVFFNDRAAEARARADCVTPYWDWRPRAAPETFYQHFSGTAPTHHLYGLRAALDIFHEEGIEAVWRRHACLARSLWAAFGAWGAEGSVELNVHDPVHRSHAVTAVRIGGDAGDRLRHFCEHRMGVTLGIGLGMAAPGSPDAGGFFRVGHMGHLSGHMMLGVVGVIETGFRALGIPHGPGAQDAAAAILADELRT